MCGTVDAAGVICEGPQVEALFCEEHHSLYVEYLNFCEGQAVSPITPQHFQEHLRYGSPAARMTPRCCRSLLYFLEGR